MTREHSPRLALEERIVYLSESEGQITGMIAGHLTRRYRCSGEVQWVDVDFSRSRRGIASALLYVLADWFVERDALRVCVDVRPENERARAFYRARGAEVLNEHWMVWKDISAILR